ncbi:MAG: hypothetical protein WC836_08155 [Desulfobacula sp.]|jgi:hypothetical protein
MVGNDFNETHQIPEILKNLLEIHEDWLMEQILMYAKKQGYTAYTSTLKEAWRLSVSGLSATAYRIRQNNRNMNCLSTGCLTAWRSDSALNGQEKAKTNPWRLCRKTIV